MKNRKPIIGFIAALTLGALTGCTGGGKKNGAFFTYEDISFTDTIGSKTNDESYNYGALKVNKVENTLRDDFAFGVDASMVKVVEDCGGVYFNQNGQEQEVFQILRKSGVNFVRFRLWNNPFNKWDDPYGGGNNNAEVDIELAKRAKAANLNVMIDFHYSDFWADPDRQNIPREWGGYLQSEIPQAIENFTTETLQKFKDAGVTVDAVQIGNETNNGLCGYAINWNDVDRSFDTMADMFKSGIKGAKKVFKDVKTMIHLANGGNTAEYENYFTKLDARGVDYDIIGASFYPHLSGTMDDLQTNLDNISKKTGKPVIVAETSWGFTDEYNENTENSYSSADEEVGGYLTSTQAQATMLRDICNVLSKVPENRGLGIFYWEPEWLPVEGASWATAAGQSYQYYGNDSKRTSYTDGKATWSNQGLFSYTGKALPSINTFQYVRNGLNEATEQSVSARHETISITINLAADEKLPATARVVTDFDAIRYAPVSWDNDAVEAVKTRGVHTGLKGVLDGKFNITASANCIVNYVVDPGFENQGESDEVVDPWKLSNITPSGEKVIKLDRKKDIRSGRTDLNWYHSSKDFGFTVSQTIKITKTSTFTLRTYVMGASIKALPHTELVLFLNVKNGSTYELDLCNADYLSGWSDGYKECVIKDVPLKDGDEITIGLRGAAKAGAWAHNDDWELIDAD